MRKKILFIGMIILVASSAANAGVFSWLWGFVTPVPAPPGGQAQIGAAAGVNAVSNYGTGMTSSSRANTWTNTRSSPIGTQSSSITAGQSGYVSGLSPYSYGQSYSTTKVWTSQYQQVW